MHGISLTNPLLISLEFEQWKSTVEELEDCTYVKATGKKKDPKKGGEVHYFQCNRGGEYRPKGKGHRKLKSQGKTKVLFSF